jgi:hypothetical protein
MKKTIVFLVAALALPTSVAIAKGPPSNPGKSAPKVTYVLKGTLSGYEPYDSSTSTDGQITITVKHSNYHAKGLKNQLLTFAVTAKTRVTFRHGTTVDQIEGAKGRVTVRAPKRIAPADLVATIQTYPARHVVVQRAAS